MNHQIEDLFKINDQCLKISNKIKSLVSFPNSKEIEYYTALKLSFTQHSTKYPNFYILKQLDGTPKKKKVPNLIEHFESLWNPLKTSFPFGLDFQDMTEDLKAYQLLDEKKGAKLVESLRESLVNTRETLEQILKEVEIEMGLGSQAISYIVSEILLYHSSIPFEKHGRTPNEIWFKLKPNESYLNQLKLEFDIDLTHQRALDHIQSFSQIIGRYFDPIEPSELDTVMENEMSGFLKDSSIPLRINQRQLIRDWISEVGLQETNTTLLYRGSTDGFKAKDFHNKCDTKGKTIVLVKSDENRVFGGFANPSWHNKGNIEDRERKTFLFSLDEKKKFANKDHYSIYGSVNSGPIFGGGKGHGYDDLHIDNDCNISKNSYSNPSSYQLPSDTILAGSKKFRVKEIEVWSLNE